MKVSAEESLWLTLPILLVVITLVGGILYLQNTSTTDIRSKAAEPRPRPAVVVTPQIIQAIPQNPEVVCTTVYDPVCSISGKTYPNTCEANLDGATRFTPGPCTSPTPIAFPSAN